MQGATVFVTGGSRGIGKAIALRFADLGAARVAIGYLRNDRAAEATAEELRAKGAEPVLVRGNVSSERVAREVAELGPLQALVHNAATGVIRPALETEDKHWDWTLAANARALLSLARAAAPQMPEGSSIVGISSLGSTRVLTDYVLVGTSKAALESLVRYLAVELAPRGIRVNAVSGGVVDTEALQYFPQKEQMLEWGQQRTPAGRLVTAEDIANAVVFLCSPEAEMIRGHVLVVDGGFLLPRTGVVRRQRLNLVRGQTLGREVKSFEPLARPRRASSFDSVAAFRSFDPSHRPADGGRATSATRRNLTIQV